jgi:hypothetical protein
MQPPAITPDLKTAAETLIGAQAYIALIRPVVEGYQRRILAKHQFRIARTWVERGDEDSIILDPNHSYLLEDDDASVVYDEFHAEALAHGFDVPPSHCPLLMAESMVIQAERALLLAAQYITKIDPDEFWDMKLRRELIDLTLNFVVASAGINTASVLSNYR